MSNQHVPNRPGFLDRRERLLISPRLRVTALFLVCLVVPQNLWAQAAPKLDAVYPFGGQRGTTVDLEIRGTGLEGAHTVWLGAASKLESPKSSSVSLHTKGPDGTEAFVRKVKGGRAAVRLILATDARVGFHGVSLITPGGVSGSIPFWVGPDAVLQESATPHRTPDTAQPVKFPVAIHGHISETGQLAYYEFEVPRKQTVAFEVVALHEPGFDPQIALYEAGGSFLDPRRSKRLVFHEEITQGGMPANRRMTYHFTKPRRCLVSLGQPFAQGAGDFSYLLWIAPLGPANRAGQAEEALAWGRRRMHGLLARTVGTAGGPVGLVREAEPNDEPEQAKTFAVPAVLEGTIGRPGDIDFYRFKGRAGQKLVFEVQAPRGRSALQPPLGRARCPERRGAEQPVGPRGKDRHGGCQGDAGCSGTSGNAGP